MIVVKACALIETTNKISISDLVFQNGRNSCVDGEAGKSCYSTGITIFGFTQVFSSGV